MKRKIYIAAIGIVLSQLSIAEVWNSPSAKHFGDCPTCNAAAEVPFPLDNKPGSSLTAMVSTIQANLGKTVTGFTHGNALGATKYQAALNTMSQSVVSTPQATPQPPLVPPRVSLPTQSYVDSLFPQNWMQNCLPVTAVQPSTPMYWPSTPSRMYWY